jgi:hypothetical protein
MFAEKVTTDLKGHFKIQSIDALTGEVLDTFEKRNMIMDVGRNNLALLLSGISGSYKINKFVLGTDGAKSGQPTVPKDETDGFISSRTSLFSEIDTNLYEYYITFTPNSNASYASIAETDTAAGSTMLITQTNNIIQYDIELSSLAANNTTSVNYTEAGFYAGDVLFAMRTFPVKVKNSSTKLKITWQFVF